MVPVLAGSHIYMRAVETGTPVIAGVIDQRRQVSGSQGLVQDTCDGPDGIHRLAPARYR